MDAQRSAKLIRQIERIVVPHGQLALWALGQAGFVMKGGDTIAYIDPYLSNSITEAGGAQRRFPVPIDPATITHAQVVFVTHDHPDHLDVATLIPLLTASPTATLITSPPGAVRMRKAGIAHDRIVTPVLGKWKRLADLSYTAIPAAHYNFEIDLDGCSTWQGFLINCNGITLYHAGDTLIFPELLCALEGVVVDVALLPFNGRDHFREALGIIGNMWPNEAVQLAQLLKARVLIGIHNDLFTENRLNTGMLFDAIDTYAPRQRCHVLLPGEGYVYVKDE